MTIHAEEEMTFDDFTIFDVENAILSGQIIERQNDADTGNSSMSSKDRRCRIEPWASLGS